MGRPRHELDDRAQTSVNLLMSILVRYPEIATVRFDPRGRCLKFTLIIRKHAGKPGRERSFRKLLDIFETKLRESLSSYQSLIDIEPSQFEVDKTEAGNFCIITIRRDVMTLTHDEISLIIDLANDVFARNLVVDHEAALMEEERMAQDEMIANMLDDLRESREGAKLIGFREEGRVVIFNKLAQGRR